MRIPRPDRLLLQALNYAAFMAVVWYFSLYPVYRHIDDDQAVLTLAFSHAGKLVEECVTRTPEELERLAPNMRVAFDCPRERSPVVLVLQLDGESATRMEYKAPGLYNDQGVHVYRELVTTAGRHELALSMNDDVNVEGPTHRLWRTIELSPAQRLVITFDSTREEFVLR